MNNPQHCVAMQLSSKAVHCYTCKDYVINDTRRGGVLEGLRRSLDETTTGIVSSSCTRRGTPLRSAVNMYSSSSQGQGIDPLRFTRFKSKGRAKRLDKLQSARDRWDRFQMHTALRNWQANRLQAGTPRSSKSSPVPPSPLFPVTPGAPMPQLPRGKTGLRNIGNTCYMNAVVQALGHVKSFRDCFYTAFRQVPTPLEVNGLSLQRIHSLDCAKALKQKKAPDSAKAESWLLCREIHSLLRVLWSGRFAVVTPNSLLSSVWHVDTKFRGFSQHDAEEFYLSLLHRLNVELHLLAEEREDSPPSSPEFKIPKQFDYFSGSSVTEVTCDHCRNKVEREEASLHISLAIPLPAEVLQAALNPGRRPQKNKERPKAQEANCKPFALSELLKNHFGEEKLDGDELYMCGKCKKKRPATIRHRLLRAPRGLMLSVQRNSFLHGKLRSMVNFPLTGLNLRPYTTKPGGPPLLYDLVAVVDHLGQHHDRGHYTCTALNQGQWILYNDATTKVLSEAHVCSRDAYLLFYIQRDIKAPLQARRYTAVSPCPFDLPVVRSDRQALPRSTRRRSSAAEFIASEVMAGRSPSAAVVEAGSAGRSNSQGTQGKLGKRKLRVSVPCSSPRDKAVVDAPKKAAKRPRSIVTRGSARQAGGVSRV